MKKIFIFSLLTFSSLSVFTYAIWLIHDQDVPIKFKDQKIDFSSKTTVIIKTFNSEEKIKSNPIVIQKAEKSNDLKAPKKANNTILSGLKRSESVFFDNYFKLQKKPVRPNNFKNQSFSILRVSNDLLNWDQEMELSLDNSYQYDVTSF